MKLEFEKEFYFCFDAKIKARVRRYGCSKKRADGTLSAKPTNQSKIPEKERETERRERERERETDK
jgi:hypothetical protein